MRDIAELNINEGGRPVTRAAPTAALIREFEAAFGVRLPDAYVNLLRAANGGHPEVDTIAPRGRADRARWSVNQIYHLDDDRTSASSLWAATKKWRATLGAHAIPFANDGCGNQFFLDLKTSQPAVRVWAHDPDSTVVDVAPTFESFIDSLYVDPEMI